MTTIEQPKKQTRSVFVIVLVAYACIMTAAILVANHGPAKFATYLPGGGVNLFRDGQELSVYHERASFIYQHTAPYAQSRIEYPLLGAMYVAIPALFASGQSGFSLGLMILNSVVGAVLLYVTYRLLVWFNRPASLLWLFFLPGAVYFTLNRFDILPALLVQVSLLLLFTKRWNWSFFFLGLSVLAKGYAVLLFPIFFIYWLNQTGSTKNIIWKNKVLWLTVGTVIAGVLISIMLAGFKNGIFPYYFQSTRSFAFGSIYTIFIVGIWSMVGVGAVNAIMHISTKVMILIQFVLPALIFGGHAFFKRFIAKPENVINWSIIVILIYILFSPYYSPQWLLWLVPLLMVWQPTRLAALFVIAYGLSGYLEYPVAINIFGFDSIHYNMLVLLRTVLLVGMLVIVSQQMKPYATKNNLMPEVNKE
ncbi:MAG: hypothetical protein V1668_03600 [Patescibacteria group bacterium]